MKKLSVLFRRKAGLLSNKYKYRALDIAMDNNDTYQINYIDRTISVDARLSDGSINKTYVYDFEPGDIFTIKEEIESD